MQDAAGKDLTAVVISARFRAWKEPVWAGVA